MLSHLGDHQDPKKEIPRNGHPPSQYELTLLQALAKQFPNIDSAVAEIARLSAVLTLPKGTVHIISDIHGEDKKLRHVINNASGTLRPLVEQLFQHRLEPREFQEFLTLVFYPAEVTLQLEKTLTDSVSLRAFGRKTLRLQFELIRVLATRYSLKRTMQVFPREYADLFSEMLHEPTADRGCEFVDAIVEKLLEQGQILHLIHLSGRLIRNLAVYELIIGGDCWDRGPRGDRVVDYLRDQPNVSFIWGNHDMSWLGASLGHRALICNVLRVSLRYRRLGQLDEGYSIPLTPLEHLARTVYADDPAEYFYPKATGMRPSDLVARMQKAAAIMQFKLEGQMLARNPEWDLEHRRLLHRIDHIQATIEVDGTCYPLRDSYFPTLNPNAPYDLTPDEEVCLSRLQHSFVSSSKLKEHMQYLVSNGAMYVCRDDHLLFHGCVPCDATGEFLPMPVDGNQLAGRQLFNAIERVVFRAAESRQEKDLDFLWYLWSGPRSPLFGKDRIATLERDLITDKHPHHETKDPYFSLIHESWFCEKVLTEFGVSPVTGLIVNGHVPVKIEEGESPLKRSGKAITIDGAFSEAYGDHGFTLVLEANRTLLARHHHFESVEAAIRTGVDIVPCVTVVREWKEPRRMAETERGENLRAQIEMLERLMELYRNHNLRQDDWRQIARQ